MAHEIVSWWTLLKPEAQAAWVQAIGSIAAIFVAIGVAWWQARQTRKQQRKYWEQELHYRMIAARPHISIEEFTQREDPQLRIFIRNNGVGAAVIKRFHVLIDGVPVFFDRTTFWQRFIGALGLPPGVNSGGTVLADGQAIPAGAERTLLRYRPADLRQVDNQTLHAALARVGYDIRYESIYGERFELRAQVDDTANFYLPDPGEN